MASTDDGKNPETASVNALIIITRSLTCTFGGWTVKTTVGKTETRHNKFFRVYGCLGIPMVIIFFLSASWTLMLAVIQYMPNEFANWVMNTESFDDGQFWMLPDPDIRIKVAAMVVLCSLSVGYLSLLVLMLFPDRMVKSKCAYTATSVSEASEDATRNKRRESSSK